MGVYMYVLSLSILGLFTNMISLGFHGVLIIEFETPKRKWILLFTTVCRRYIYIPNLIS